MCCMLSILILILPYRGKFPNTETIGISETINTTKKMFNE